MDDKDLDKKLPPIAEREWLAQANKAHKRIRAMVRAGRKIVEAQEKKDETKE